MSGEALRALSETALALAAAVFVTSLLLLLLGYDPVSSLAVMFTYGLGNVEYVAAVAAPLVLSALAFLIPLRAGLFNIGGEGQAYLGALSFLYFSQQFGALGLLAGGLMGALLGGTLGALRAFLGVNEVIASIMTNWTLYYVTLFLVSRHLTHPEFPHRSIDVGFFLGSWTSFLLALALALLALVLLYNTLLGYEIRVLGSSRRAAAYAGIDVRRVTVLSMSIGGLFGGTAGALKVMYVGHLDTTMSALFGVGFLGIGVALIGKSHPIGAVLSAAFLASMIIGGHWVELRLGTPPELTDVIVGVMVLVLSAPYALKLLQRGGRLG
ncbi:MAG: ABC transporter permease [Acidilobaceae archaeon]|nr:ABC transporter permease [Acidilobaceae archaeon]MCX8166099.1 ABC transporter permease [Acidilobaceae archaeon]MDW7974742.1 ABC transporter permease [Sulfolobales archaeon]